MLDIAVGDCIITKKPHPCGGSQWLVTRTGADVKLKCMQCGRVVMLDRRDCEKRTKKLIKANENGDLQ